MAATTKPRVLTAPAAIDGAVLTVLLAVGLAGFWPVFGGLGFLRAALVGLVAGAALAWVGAWRRWRTVTVATGVLVAYFVLGAGAALPEHAIAGVVPSLTTLRDLVFGAVEVWRQFLTATTPLDTFAGMSLVPFVVALVGAVLTYTAAWRARRPAFALLPVAVVLVGTIILGTVEAFWPTVQALVLLIVALPWVAWRHRSTAADQSLGAAQESTAVKLTRLRNAVLVLGAVSLVGVFGGGAVAQGLHRDVAREHVVPPLDLRAYASPLTSLRHYVDQQADETLFTVSGWDRDDLLRLAVLDTFDGMVYAVGTDTGASRYDRVGPQLGRRSVETTGDPTVITVTVGAYTGVWLPGLSTLSMVEFAGDRVDELAESLYYNPSSDALVDPAGLREGDSYTVTAYVPDVTAQAAAGHGFATVVQPNPRLVPDAVGDQGAKLAGDAREPVERVQNIINGLQQHGYFSHGLADQEPSRPGHSSARIADLLAKPDRMVGDDEQYAVAAALMLRQLGIPARVVMGFRADDKSTFDGATWAVTGSDVHAWVEVAFEGVGWIPFDPTPNEDQKPIEETPQSRSDPKPQILQPPPPPTEPDAEDPDNVPEERDTEEEEKPEGIPWARIGQIAAATGIPLVLLLGPPLIIAWLKRRRTTRRQKAASPSSRLAGGWQELLDRAADLGTVIPAAATRRQASRLLAQRYNTEAVTDLADRADRGVFAVEEPTDAEIKTYWNDVATARTAFARAVSRGRRWRARIALTSLRRHPTPTAELEPLP
jgi:transglutaminase-like putative cysteine protease